MNTEIENTDSENTEVASTESENTESAGIESENAEIASAEIENTESDNIESASAYSKNTESASAEIEDTESENAEIENTESEADEETPTEVASQDVPVAEEQSSDTSTTSASSEIEESTEEMPTEAASQDTPVAEEQASDATDTDAAPAPSETEESEASESDTSAPKSIFQDAPMPPLPDHPSLAKKDEKEGDDAEMEAHDTSSLGHPGMFAEDDNSMSFPPHERKIDNYTHSDQRDDAERDGGVFVRNQERYPRRRNRTRYRYRIDKEQFAQMTIDYKNPDVLRRFITETGAILPRRVTGISATQQRKVVHAIKRARFLALLPMG